MPPSPLTPRPFRAALPVLLLITSVFLLNFLSRVVLAPLMPAVRLELGISHAEAGSFFLIMAAGVSIGLLSNSFVSSRLTHRRTIALSALVTGVALIGASQVASLTVFKVLWALAGLGAGLYLPSGIATVTSLLEKKHWGKGLATHEMAPNGSFILAPILAELMLAVADWRTTLTFLGIAQVIIAFVFLRGCKAGAFPGAPIRRAIAGRILLRRSFWVMAVLFTLGVVASMGPYSMIPLYLVDMGWERTQANQLLAVSRILAFGMPFAAGWLVDRIGGKRTIGVYLVCASAATIFLGLAQGNWLTLAVLLQPMVAVTFFPAAFTSLSHLYPPAERSMAISFLVPFAMFAGIGAGPMVLGFLGDQGRFGLGFVIVGSLVLCGLAVLPGLRLPKDEETT